MKHLFFHCSTMKVLEIFKNMLYCYNITSDFVTMHYSEEFKGITHIICNIATFDEVDRNDESLHENLIFGI